MNRNRQANIGVGVLLGVVLLFAVLASCGPDEEGSMTGRSGSAVPASDSPEPSPAATAFGALAAEPDRTSPPTTRPAATRTPHGGVDAGGGSSVTGRRLPLLMTGTFLLVAAAGLTAYAIRRPSRG
ncbi:hypothetical protein AB0G04_33285 [Actinoplanes sp. NPDC023801]|uniref:hypothetical protein n=1 Tax=Actinoplanes sp. NPDC023801 TaxID=3154595 RepID=UPI0033C5FFF9